MIVTSPRNGIAVYKFKDHVKNDTFSSLSMILKDQESNVPLDLTNVVIKFQFKLTYDGAVAIEFSTINGLISVPNPTTGEFIINENVIIADAAQYIYDAQFTYTNGTVKTYFKGTWNILQDVTV